EPRRDRVHAGAQRTAAGRPGRRWPSGAGGFGRRHRPRPAGSTARDGLMARAVALVVIAGLILVACSTDPVMRDVGGPGRPTTLAQTAWTVVSVAGRAPRVTPLTIAFRAGEHFAISRMELVSEAVGWPRATSGETP